MLITGAAGIGKSTLWSTFADSLDGDWSIEFVGGHATDRSFAAPFGALTGALAESESPARSLGLAVADACRARRGDGPLLLVVEDLHFVDPVGVMALPHVLNTVRRDPVLVVATYRSGSHEVGSTHARAVVDLLRHPAAAELRLRPLTPDGVAQLLTSLTGHEDGAASAALFERTGGNPFFVEALAQAGDTAMAAVPWTVAEVVTGALEQLPGHARRLAEWLAVAGGPVRPAVVAALTSAWRSAVHSIVDAGLAVDDGQLIRLRHALVADALLGALDPEERVLRHRDLAEALETAGGADAEDLARHWAAARQPARAAPWAGVAADRLGAGGSYERATELYDVALFDPPVSMAERAALLERASSAAAAAGQAERAQLWGSMADEARSGSERSWQAVGTWVNSVMLRQVDEAQGDSGAPPGAPAEDAGRKDELDAVAALVSEAQGAVDAGERGDGHALATAAIERARAIGDDAGLANAALVLLYAGDLAGADDVLNDVARTAAARGDWSTVSVVRSRSARVAWAGGSIGDGIARNTMALEAGRRAGGPAFWAHLAAGSAVLESWAGLIADAEAHCAEVEQVDEPMLHHMSTAARVSVSIERGDLALARVQLDTLVPIVRALGIGYFTLPVLTVQVRLQLLEGDAYGAAATLDEANAASWSPYHEAAPDLLLAEAIAATRLGDRARVERVATRLQDHALDVAGANLVGAAAYASSLVARDAVERAELALAAATAWDACPRFGWAADARCDAATHLLAADPPRARDVLAGVTDVARRHGLDRVAWRAACLAATVEPAAAPAPSTGEPHRPVSPLVDRCTPRERAILDLVAEGRTNREIADALYLSEKTVRNNLSAAFAKLGVSRRSEVAGVLWGRAAPE